MKIKAYLLTLFLIFITSFISTLLLFFYMDVETNRLVGYITMGLAVFLCSGAFLALIIYFFKKIYFRGEVYIHTINSSLRQGFFLTLGAMGMVSFYHFGVLTPLTGGLLLLAIVLTEVIIISFSDN